jgi:chemotaxis protein MotB
MVTRTGAPILVKKIKKGHGAAHHASAWKIAYADFATAMMAFFLLLWLLAATTEEQKLGIANFFMPTPYIKNDMVGSSGFSGGHTLQETGQLEAPPMTRPDVMISMSPSDWTGDEADKDLTDQALRRQIERAEEAELQRVAGELQGTISQDPQLAKLAENLLVDRTPEGLRIQILDQDRRAMFPLGSALMYPYAEALMARVATIIARTGRKVSVTGHTDAIPFQAGSQRDNWQLSSDRANASRRALVAAGLPEGRIARVVGKADTEPLDQDHPEAAKNRRISIVLLRSTRA